MNVLYHGDFRSALYGAGCLRDLGKHDGIGEALGLRMNVVHVNSNAFTLGYEEGCETLANTVAEVESFRSGKAINSEDKRQKAAELKAQAARLLAQAEALEQAD